MLTGQEIQTLGKGQGHVQGYIPAQPAVTPVWSDNPDLEVQEDEVKCRGWSGCELAPVSLPGCA